MVTHIQPDFTRRAAKIRTIHDAAILQRDGIGACQRDGQQRQQKQVYAYSVSSFPDEPRQQKVALRYVKPIEAVASTPDSYSILPIDREVNETAHRDAGWPFGHPGLGVVQPGRAGDIQMNPRCLAGKFLEKPGRGIEPPGRPPIFCKSALTLLELFAIFLVHGHLPHLVALRLGGMHPAVEQRSYRSKRPRYSGVPTPPRWPRSASPHPPGACSRSAWRR